MLTEVYLLDLSRFCSIWFVFHLIYRSTNCTFVPWSGDHDFSNTREMNWRNSFLCRQFGVVFPLNIHLVDSRKSPPSITFSCVCTMTQVRGRK